MIKKIIYNIRFPFGASFNKPVQYLFIKKIYNDIKLKTCINGEPKCSSCLLKNSCIYYKISGNDFKHYPSILIEKKFIQKLDFISNESISLIFYFIGSSIIYIDFLTEFMENNRKIYNNYFQKVKQGEFIINEEEAHTGNIKYITPINKLITIDNINEMIDFYNDNYETTISKIIEFKEYKTQHVFDEIQYKIENKLIKLNGNIGLYYVKNYPKALFEIGVTRNNILGSGKAIISTIE